MDLQEIREQIDQIDEDLVALFTKRMETVGAVAQYKSANGLRILDRGRERALLNRAAERSGEAYEAYTRQLYETLLELSRTHQRRLLGTQAPLALEIRQAMAAGTSFPTRATVACQGTEGSYSQQACDALFPGANIVYFQHFDSVFEAVEKGLCRYGLLPIENSLAGSVTQVYDLMAKHEFSIVRGICQRIDHGLLALPGSSMDAVNRVYSHPQALAQCGGFFRKHPHIQAIPCENTAIAAKNIATSGDPTAAAIASLACMPLYGLIALKDSVADSSSNHTRFVCIGKALEIYPEANRIGIAITLPHRPGALHGLMAKFAALSINLVKLESRPIPDRPFEFSFVMDMEGSLASPGLIELLCEVAENAERFQLLGAWREG